MIRTSPDFMERVTSETKWNKAYIQGICDEPNLGWNRKVLYKMLQALYEKQTEGEKAYKDSTESNGEGFNSNDAPFLSSVAEGSKKWGGLTEKQALYVGKKLRKYAGQLERIAAQKQAVAA